MSPEVRAAYDAMTEPARDRALALRDLVLRVAAAEGIVLDETLKWGEPAYLPGRRGTTLRIGIDKAGGDLRLLVNCRTSLVAQWREMFGSNLHCDGNRAVRVDRDTDEGALAICIAMALTYHQARGKAAHG